MIITIDGPAGAGKSSAARMLAERLGFRFLDTGAMYRAVTFAALQAGIALDDADALEAMVHDLELEVTDDQVFVNGQDVTDGIRTFDVTTATRYAADHPGVRARLVELQRNVTKRRDTVTEGRDQGTVVFPDAEVKIFLTASEQVRAERRHQDLLQRGERVSIEEVLKKQQARDARDTNRKIGRLVPAGDAIELVTDGMSLDQVVDQLQAIVREQPKSTIG